MLTTGHPPTEFLCRPTRAATRAEPVALVRRTRILLVVLGLLFFGGAAGAQAGSITKEYHLKAAFLYHFTKYVDWQPERFAAEDSPIIIAVLGSNPFDGELVKLVEGRTVKGRAISVRFIESLAELPSAHIVFVPAKEESRLGLSLFGEPGVLTVGESAAFAARGGIIRFTVIEEKVRFEINVASGNQAGLRFSGQLLKLATIIRKTP